MTRPPPDLRLGGDLRHLRDGRVIAADCLDPAAGMLALPDRVADLILTDPPYSEKVHTCSRRGVTDYKTDRVAASAKRNRDLGFEHLGDEVQRASAVEFARLARRWVVVFTDIEGVGSIPQPRAPEGVGWIGALVTAGLEYVRTGIWHKVGATPQLTGDRPAVGAEAIVIAHQVGDRGKPIRKRWHGGGSHAHWSFPIALDRGGKGSRVHPTQKPQPLIDRLVELFSDPEQLVLDPFAGSGTTGIACRQLGRRFLGFEREPEWAAMAQRRIDGEQARPKENQPALDFGGATP